eukprot:5826525-Ditylum_brightwellii.AAC.1
MVRRRVGVIVAIHRRRAPTRRNARCQLQHGGPRPRSLATPPGTKCSTCNRRSGPKVPRRVPRAGPACSGPSSGRPPAHRR